MTIEKNSSAVSAVAAAIFLSALSACDHPRIIDGQAAAYCEAQGHARGTDANAQCALQREAEQEAAGIRPPSQDPNKPPVLIEALPAPSHPSVVTQTIPAEVIQGKPTMVTFSFSPTCDATGIPSVSITKAPVHGTAVIVHRKDDPRLARAVVPVDCSKSKVPGVAVDYTAQHDYEGTDALEVAVVSAAGVTTLFKVPLTVEKPPTLDDIDP